MTGNTLGKIRHNIREILTHKNITRQIGCKSRALQNEGKAKNQEQIITR